jgi:hypothetical protein
MITADFSKRREYIDYIYRTLGGLSEYQREKICNGVGSGARGWKAVRPPSRIRKLFLRAADFHDLAYYLGGTEQHRAWADAEFFSAVLEAAYTEEGWRRIYARAWAVACINAVRVFGGFSWNRK